MMPQYRFLDPISAIARPIDPRLPSNIFAVVWSAGLALATVLYGGAQGQAIETSALHAVWLAFGALLAWIITRELDPDYPASAMLAAVLTPALMVGFEAEPHLIALFLLVTLTRVVNRSTGRPILWTDFIGILILVGLTATTEAWPLAFFGVLAFWMDGRLKAPHPRWAIFAGLSFGVAVAGLAYQGGPNLAFTAGLLGWLILFTVAGVSRFLVGRVPPECRAVCDRTGEPQDGERLRYTLILASVALLLLGWLGQGASMVPLWGAFLGVLAWRGWRELASSRS